MTCIMQKIRSHVHCDPFLPWSLWLALTELEMCSLPAVTYEICSLNCYFSPIEIGWLCRKTVFSMGFLLKAPFGVYRAVCAFRDFSPARMCNLWKSGHLAFEQLPISKNSFRKIIQITAGLILTITLKAEKLETSVSVCRYMYTHKTVLYQVLGLKQIFSVSVFDWVDTFYFIFSSSKWTLLSPMAAFAAIKSVPLPLGWCLEWHQSVYCWIQPKIIPQTQQRDSISLWLVMRVREQVF